MNMKSEIFTKIESAMNNYFHFEELSRLSDSLVDFLNSSFKVIDEMIEEVLLKEFSEETCHSEVNVKIRIKMMIMVTKDSELKKNTLELVSDPNGDCLQILDSPKQKEV